MKSRSQAYMENPSSQHLSRRDFIKFLAIAIGAFVGTGMGVPGLAYLVSPALRNPPAKAWIPLGSTAEIQIGIPTFFSFIRRQINGWENTVTSYGVFAIRDDETRIRVLSNICTHLGCHVTWHADINEFVSPCHNGHFDIHGQVTFGPPPRPLDEFQTRVENGQLSILFPPFRRS